MERNSKILRIWKGWTTKENADNYEDFLIKEVFPEIQKKAVNGLEKASISSQEKEGEVTFLLMLQFESLDAVKSFAGENYEIAYIPEKAKSLLLRYDDRTQHYELREVLEF